MDVRNLRVTLPSKHGSLSAVESVDFTVNTSEIVGIAGESGSGKTLSVLATLGLLPGHGTATGAAMFQGRDLLSMSKKQLQSVRGAEIGVVFQDPMNSLHPMLSIGKQLTEHQLVHLGISKNEALGRAQELLETVRIPNAAEALKRHPHEFSGGMRQRIAIAMALACNPKVLIADEPTTALDVTVQAGILRLIDRLRREQQLAVIMITHDLAVLSAVADRLYVMYSGRVVESGKTTDVLASPRHPYTQGLLGALPDDEDPQRPLAPIPGAPPVLGAPKVGCSFQPRCAFAEDGCLRSVPLLLPTAPDRRAACPPDPLRPDPFRSRREYG